MATAKFGQIFCLHVLELVGTDMQSITRQIWAKIGTILADATLCGHDAKLHFYMMLLLAVCSLQFAVVITAPGAPYLGLVACFILLETRRRSYCSSNR